MVDIHSLAKGIRCAQGYAFGVQHGYRSAVGGWNQAAKIGYLTADECGIPAGGGRQMIQCTLDSGMRAAAGENEDIPSGTPPEIQYPGPFGEKKKGHELGGARSGIARGEMETEQGPPVLENQQGAAVGRRPEAIESGIEINGNGAHRCFGNQGP